MSVREGGRGVLNPSNSNLFAGDFGDRQMGDDAAEYYVDDFGVEEYLLRFRTFVLTSQGLSIGSYLGDEHYRDNVAYLRQSLSRYGVGAKLEAKLHGWVIGQFVRYTAHDAQCSHGYAQRVIVDTVDGETLSELTHHLITDALDLIEDDMREYLKEEV